MRVQAKTDLHLLLYLLLLLQRWFLKPRHQQYQSEVTDKKTPHGERSATALVRQQQRRLQHQTHILKKPSNKLPQAPPQAKTAPKAPTATTASRQRSSGAPPPPPPPGQNGESQTGGARISVTFGLLTRHRSGTSPMMDLLRAPTSMVATRVVGARKRAPCRQQGLAV